MFSKVLIANRGEIAVRIIRACKEMGISTVAVYSEADRDALHVALADESYCIGGASAADSYLNEERIVSAALVSGAQAIHAGYGFLSENAHFSQLCAKNGIVFIGPAAETMERLSDKTTIKNLMEEAGRALGLAFQIEDDILDMTSNAETLGKSVNIDEKNDKETIARTLGLEMSEELVKMYTTKAINAVSVLGKDSKFLLKLFESLIYRKL